MAPESGIQSDPLIESILSRIHFRLVSETTPGNLFDTTRLDDDKLYKAIDVANTAIEDRQTPIFNLEFLRTPRMSTLGIGYLLNRLVREMPDDQCYLNIGTWCGFTLLSGCLGNPSKHCIGIDIFAEPASKPVFEFQYGRFRTPRTEFHEMDFRRYLATQHRSPIGVFLYDGPAAYQDQQDALMAAAPYLASGAYVVLDDINEPHRAGSARDFMAAHPGQFRVVLERRTPNNGHPTFWNGIMVLRKQGERGT